MTQAEIWCAEDLLAEICLHGDLPQIEIYPRRDNTPWKVRARGSNGIPQRCVVCGEPTEKLMA
jgi:hypothetical protein